MKPYISDKPVTSILVDLCHAYGVKHVILSPGSRNAPLIISFSGCGLFNCLSISDERSAAYFALGLAKITRNPVAIVCTSGTAALNYAPAVAEAYYQKTSLIVITADRPAKMVDQADGQTIRQSGVYKNFIRYKCSLPETCGNDDMLYVNRLLNEAFIKTTGSVQGPVHINIPFKEPLYGKTDYKPRKSEKIELLHKSSDLLAEDVNILSKEMASHKRIMVLVGADYPNKHLTEALSEMANKGVVVITETLSNCRDKLFFENTDRIVSTIRENEYTLFSPDLLITFDTPVLSRMIKKMLRVAKPEAHWHFTNDTTVVDTYDSLTRMVGGNPEHTLSVLAKKMNTVDEGFSEIWQKRYNSTTLNHNAFTENMPWCDLKLFKILSTTIIPTTQIYLGNSTPVRYAQLFNWQGHHQWFANRGTSGIDGCVSTAAGAAYGSTEPLLLITGDMSFIYDSNGLWHNYLTPSFRIFVVNNGGGGIFRYLHGSAETEELEEFFETRQTANCEGIARTFGLFYSACRDENSFIKALETFFDESSQPKLLELFTPKEINGLVLKKYFEKLGSFFSQ